MRALAPWMGMTSLKKDMDRVFERFFEAGWRDLPTLGGWEPKVDLTEGKDAIVVKAEIPGVEQKDIEVTVQDGTLTIKGEKQEETEEKDRRYHCIERSYGAFARTLRLPAAIDPGKVTATFKDGVVTVTMPKSAEARGTLIPIKAE
jgi:HSP20 family protein